jgi:threonine dehydratase
MIDEPSAKNDERLTLEQIRAAHDRIRGKIHRTPVMTSTALNELSGCSLFFKCENLQKVGAFKARGAANAVFSLSESEAARGVATHSSGNHGGALAWAAGLRGIPAYVDMPRTAPKAKIASVRRYGAEVIFCEPNSEAREREADRVVATTGAVLIHPYNDLRIMAGQGTTGIEFLEEVPELDAILCPVGGGGQLSGVAVAAKKLKPGIRIYGIEPAAQNDDDAAQSFKSAHLVKHRGASTIADGLRTSLGTKTFAEILGHVDDIVTVSEEEIIRAMRRVWEVLKLVVEPSGAVAFAAIMDGRAAMTAKRVGVILSGGNLDLDHLPWQQAASASNRDSTPAAVHPDSR